MTVSSRSSLLRPNDPRWKEINAQQEAEDAARDGALTVAERLDRGMELSRFAAELRRAAWEARDGRPAS
jgi:hypothetical protein